MSLVSASCVPLINVSRPPPPSFKIAGVESVFSLILRMTGKTNFQTGKAFFSPVEFSKIPSNFKR